MPDSAVSFLRCKPLLLAAAFILVIASPRFVLADDSVHPDAAAGSPEASHAAASQAGDAREALRKAVRFHREAKDLSLKFKASVYNPSLDKQDQYQGKLLLKGASKFRLEIPGGTYVSDGDSYWEYHAQNRQVILKSAKDMDEKPLPGEVLLRFLDSDPISIGKAVEGGKEFLEMRLDPSRAMKNLDSLAVLLDKSDYSVHRISSRDLSGNEAEYTVTAIKRNAGIKDKEFRFAVPKGADVVDMRE
jgi:outer membrane lipoprotein-sorting protein